jgi:chorismate synthase
MPIYFNVAFKPVATIMQDQKSVNKQGEEVILEGKGRHDPCVLPRAVPIVESMAALVMVDFLLLARCNRL